MKASRLVCLSLVLAIAMAGYPFAEEDHIINLGEPTFGIAADEFHDGLFVYFYEPFCAPCREMWEDLKQTASALIKAGSRVRVAKVECHDEVKLCDARSVTSFPSLLLHRKGKATVEFRGNRNANEMVHWLQKAVDFKFPDRNSGDLFKYFSTAIIVKSGSSFPINEAYKDLIDQVEVSTANSLSEYKDKIGGDAGLIVTSSGHTEKIGSGDQAGTIISKVKKIFHDGLGIPNFNQDISLGIQKDSKDQYFLFFRTQKFSSNSAEAKAFEKAAKTAQEKGLKPFFVNVYNDILGATLGKMYGVGEADPVAIGILKKNNNIYEKYFEKSVSDSSIATFLADFGSSKLARHYITAKPVTYTVNSKSPMRRYVRDLVGNDYNELLAKSGKNIFDKYVFVHFYFPWCEWCVKLEPTWNSLAYRMRNHKNVIIARTDVSENDVPGFDMSEYPTLIFFKATPDKEMGSKDYTVYYGKRDITSLLKLLFDNVPGLEKDYEL